MKVQIKCQHCDRTDTIEAVIRPAAHLLSDYCSKCWGDVRDAVLNARRASAMRVALRRANRR